MLQLCASEPLQYKLAAVKKVCRSSSKVPVTLHHYHHHVHEGLGVFPVL